MFGRIKRSVKQVDTSAPTQAAEEKTPKKTPGKKKPAKAVKPAKPIQFSTASVRSARMAALMGRKADHIHARTQMAATQSKEFGTLRALTTTVARYNLSKPLMAFADRGGMLSSMIAALPAVESLSLVTPNKRDRRTANALEGLRAALSAERGAIEDWLEDTANDTGTFFDTVASELSGLEESITAVRSRLPESIDEDTANMVTTINVPASSREEQLDTLTDIVSQLAPIDIEALSTDAEYRSQAKAALLELCERLKGMSGMDHEDGEIQPPSDGDIAEEHTDRDESLAGLGYTPDTVSSLLAKAETLLSALNNLISQRAEIVSGLSESASETPASEDVDPDYVADVKDPEEAPGTGEEIPVKDAIGDGVVKEGPGQEEPKTSTEDLGDGAGDEAGEAGGSDDDEGEGEDYTLDDHREIIANYVHVLVCATRCSVDAVVGVIAAAEALSDAGGDASDEVGDAADDVTETVTETETTEGGDETDETAE